MKMTLQTKWFRPCRTFEICGIGIPASRRAGPANTFRAFSPAPSGRVSGRAGFTVLEMLLVAGIFAIMVTWMVSSQLYGMRVYTLAKTKLVATAGARQVITSLRDQIRQANSVYVGNCSSSWNTYADVTNGLMQGNALEIYPTANTNPFLICYLDTSTPTNRLMLYNSGQGTTNDLCDYVTNKLVFDAEDVYGNILTSNVDNRVIGITMQLSQWEYSIAHFGNTNFNYYNFYQLRTRATRRAIN